MRTIYEMRRELINICNSQLCTLCPLHGNNYKCGRGYSFRTPSNEDGHLDAKEILRHFNAAFPQYTQDKVFMTQAELEEKLGHPVKIVNEIWKPKQDELYYYANSHGYVSETYWMNHYIDRNNYALGNCFKTREEAKFVSERQKVIAELSRYAQKYHTEPHLNVHIMYDEENNKIHYMHRLKQYKTIEDSLGFSNVDLAKETVQQIGEDRILKYLFNVGTHEEEK